jgi:uncharacterized membrane protein YgcG
MSRTTWIAVLATAIVAAAMAAVLVLILAPAPARTAGPPYPPQVTGQRVYDTAGVFSPADIETAEGRIRSIEERTGAQIVVYTQVKPESDSPELAQADADALGTEWGVGRRGFDDGLVILFDMDGSRCHGQVQLDAGAGFAAAFLSNSERQAIYEETMLPALRQCRMGAALLAALERIDAAATPEHAATLERARQLDAVLGLLVAPLLFVLLAGFAVWHWLRFGKDPVYLDDPSIHMPAPPPDLTPASAALIWDGRTSRRTLTTAMLDLASHGEIAFRSEQWGRIIKQDKVGIETRPVVEDTAELRLVRRHALGPAERTALDAIRGLEGTDGTGYLDPDAILGLSTKVAAFNAQLEDHVVDRGWFGKAPRKVTTMWLLGAGAEGIAGVIAFAIGLTQPSQGLVLLGIALALAAVVTGILGWQMPARTMAGAMIRAMLAAYRRTLDKTMKQARSMRQVVDESQLDWLETPDQAVVWGVALGLQDRVQAVLDRSLEDLRDGQVPASSVWLPIWYGSGSSQSSGSGAIGGGLMSSSAIPNFGAMMAVIGTIGSAPSSSGGGGGSFGGGGGFGGGGAGGGF